MPVNYFLVLTSIIVHGITIPVGKGFHSVRTRTINNSATPTDTSDPMAIKRSNIRDLLPFTRVGNSRTSTIQPPVATPDQPANREMSGPNLAQDLGEASDQGEGPNDITQPSLGPSTEVVAR